MADGNEDRRPTKDLPLHTWCIYTNNAHTPLPAVAVKRLPAPATPATLRAAVSSRAQTVQIYIPTRARRCTGNSQYIKLTMGASFYYAAGVINTHLGAGISICTRPLVTVASPLGYNVVL